MESRQEEANEPACQQTPFKAFEELTKKLLRVKKSGLDLKAPINRPRKRQPETPISDVPLSEAVGE